MRQLSLHTFFVTHNAKFISFGDWQVPAYVTSIIDEHMTVRSTAGIFDISHMGEIHITGPDCKEFLQYLIANDINKLEDSKAFYTPLCNEKGGIVDDIFVYRVSDQHFFLCVNAATIEKDYSWIMKWSKKYNVTVTNVSDTRAIISLQGPSSESILRDAMGVDFSVIPFHGFTKTKFNDRDVVLSASGYTGERGCELFFDKDIAVELWNALIDAGTSYGLKPIGFGARDTLRLEAGCLLYGQDMNDATTPFEVGIGWTVSLDKKDYVGKDALVLQKQRGCEYKLVGFEMIDRAVPRHGYNVLHGETVIGCVTSGSFTPTVGKNIGFVFIKEKYSALDTEIAIDIRGKRYNAKIIKTPFYRRKK